MANQFLVEIHSHISQQMERCRLAFENIDGIEDKSRRSFYEGQLEEWKALRAYLSESFDLNTQRYY